MGRQMLTECALAQHHARSAQHHHRDDGQHECRALHSLGAASTCTINSSSLNQTRRLLGRRDHPLFARGSMGLGNRTVTASSPGNVTISYTQLTQYELPKSGNPFYLTGKFSQLDSPGEF